MDLGDRASLSHAVLSIVPKVDLVMHFAAVAYVGECVGA